MSVFVRVSFNSSLSSSIAGQSSGAYLLEKDEDAEDGAKDPVTVRGAYASLIYLRHLRIRELKVKKLSKTGIIDIKDFRGFGLSTYRSIKKFYHTFLNVFHAKMFFCFVLHELLLLLSK